MKKNRYATQYSITINYMHILEIHLATVKTSLLSFSDLGNDPEKINLPIFPSTSSYLTDRTHISLYKAKNSKTFPRYRGRANINGRLYL